MKKDNVFELFNKVRGGISYNEFKQIIDDIYNTGEDAGYGCGYDEGYSKGYSEGKKGLEYW